MTLAEQVFQFIKHGDEEHQAWLRHKLVEFFEGQKTKVSGDSPSTTTTVNRDTIPGTVSDLRTT